MQAMLLGCIPLHPVLLPTYSFPLQRCVGGVIANLLLFAFAGLYYCI